MMTPVDSSQETRNTFSLPALLCAALGLLLLFLRRPIQQMVPWLESDPFTLAWLLVSAIMLLWGLSHSVVRSSARGRYSLLTRYRVSLPRPGLVYLVMMIVMLTGSLLGRSNMLMLIFGLMAGPFVLNGWITFSMVRSIRATRQAPRSVMSGETAAVDIMIENPRRLFSAWVMTVRDVVSNGRERLEPEVLFYRIPRRGRRHAAYQIRLTQRGRYLLGPLSVSTRFPLGLVERATLIPAHAEILVVPRLGRLSPHWKREHLLDAELVHQQRLSRGVFEDEFHSIREFRSGDNPKAIHWRTSARQNQLMAREYHQSRDRSLQVLLDLWSPSAATPESRRLEEIAISFAATLCVEQMRLSRDSRLEFAVAGQEFGRWEGRSGPAATESLMEKLALVASSPSADWKPLRDLAAHRSATVTRTVLITTRARRSMTTEFERAWSLSGERDGDSPRDVQVIVANEEDLARMFHLE